MLNKSKIFTICNSKKRERERGNDRERTHTHTVNFVGSFMANAHHTVDTISLNNHFCPSYLNIHHAIHSRYVWNKLIVVSDAL